MDMERKEENKQQSYRANRPPELECFPPSRQIHGPDRRRYDMRSQRTEAIEPLNFPSDTL